jgi:hypothetical protein
MMASLSGQWREAVGTEQMGAVLVDQREDACRAWETDSLSLQQTHTHTSTP